MKAADTALNMSAGVSSLPKLPAVPEVVVSASHFRCNVQSVANCRIWQRCANCQHQASSYEDYNRGSPGSLTQGIGRSTEAGEAQWEPVGVNGGLQM